MNHNTIFRALQFAVLVLAIGTAQAAISPVDAGSITLERGTHKLLRETGAVRRVAVGDPAIADVNIINKRELLITGKTVGVTSLIIWPEATPAYPRQFSLKVAGAGQISIKDDAELSRARIDAGRSLQGTLPNLMAHRRAKLAANNGAKEAASDLSTVDAGTQVMTEVKIAEISRNTVQQLGFNIFKNSANSLGSFTKPGGLSSFESDTTSASGVKFNQSLPIVNAFNIVAGSPSEGLLGVLSVLEGKGMARVLAEPTLLATSGQTANYLAGGEFPVPVSQGTAGSISIQYKEFGVRLSISPTVLSRNRIALKVAPEVSDLDFSAGIQIGGVAVPALTVRRTDTNVELGDGESFVISGLVSSTLLNNVNKVPWIGDVPVLGAFFRSTNIKKEDKELVMIVTPHLVHPIRNGAKLPPLPGAAYDKYDPSFAGTMLIESGKFETGFSR